MNRSTTLAAQAPHITCPSWCIVTEAEHQADLDNWDGRCLHRSEEAGDWSIASTTTPDGQPWPEPGEESVELAVNDSLVTLDEAEAHAQTILALVQAARAEKVA